MIHILLVDDHISVGEGTKIRLEQEEDMTVTVVSSSMEALRLVEEGISFGCMLFDLNMPTINGLELTRRIMEHNPESIVLIYSGYDIAPNFNILIEAGVSGFVSKASSWEQLINAIRCAVRGESVLPTSLFRQLRRNELRVPAVGGSSDTAKSLEQVSINQKEQAILQEVAQGKSNKDIASQFFMSQRTVEYNLTRIFEKLGVRSRSEAITVAKRYGLISSTDFV